jgi:hypothetical protein
MRALVLYCLLVLSLGAFATSTQPEKSQSVLTESLSSSPSQPVLMEVGTGITTAMTGAQPGLHVAVNAPIGKSGIYVGGETGAYFYTTPQLGLYLPILASVAARFDLSQKSYLMLGLSPGIGLVSYDNSRGSGVIVGKDYSDVYFNLLIKPSFNLSVGEGTLVLFSPRIGTLNGNLLFSPVIGTSIEL